MKRSILPILLFCLLTFCLPLVSLLPQAAGQAASSVSLAAARGSKAPPPPLCRKALPYPRRPSPPRPPKHPRLPRR